MPQDDRVPQGMNHQNSNLLNQFKPQDDKDDRVPQGMNHQLSNLLNQFKPQDEKEDSPPRNEPLVLQLAEPVQATRQPRQQSPPRNEPLVLQQGPSAFFDSHFHLDRTACELWGMREVLAVKMDDILRETLVHAPNNPVTLTGEVIVFCDPGTTLSIPLMDGRWKVAVGLHPYSFNHDEAYLDQVRTLVQTNPLVAALGEIGLDRTIPDFFVG